ncbi:MAG: hypothetical protein WD266_01030 [Balneolales bacterium]
MHFIADFKIPCFLSVVIIVLSGCGLISDSDSENTFVINVESIAAPESVALGDTVVINFFGIIGNNGCFHFSHFEDFEADDGLEIEAHGGFSGGRSCPEVIVDLDGKAFRYVPDSPGEKIIRVLRPQSDPLERRVTVE